MTGPSSQVLRDGSKNRATAATSLNAHSSRSHALLSVKVTFAAARDGQPCTSTINLVDLAGSERVDKSEVRWLIRVGGRSVDPAGSERVDKSEVRWLIWMGGDLWIWLDLSVWTRAGCFC